MRALYWARNHKINSKYKSRNTKAPKCPVIGLWKCTSTQDYGITLRTPSLLFSIETSRHLPTWGPSWNLLAADHHLVFLSSIMAHPSLCFYSQHPDLQGQEQQAGESTLQLGTQSIALLREGGRALENSAQGWTPSRKKGRWSPWTYAQPPGIHSFGGRLLGTRGEAN